MIIVMKPKAADKNIKAVTQYIEANGLTAHLSQGEQVTIIGVVGDKSRLSTENIALLADVDRIVPVTESYKLANLKFHPEPSVVKVGCTSIGHPDDYGRSLRGGIQRPADADRRSSQEKRRDHPARRCI